MSVLVDVRAEHQVVTLRGYVANYDQRVLAESRIATVAGVFDVDNRLVVAYSPGDTQWR